MQSIGQMSTQASHSMQSVPVNTVCNVAVQAALGLVEGELGIEAQLDLGHDVLQRLGLGACGTLKRWSMVGAFVASSTRGCPSSG